MTRKPDATSEPTGVGAGSAPSTSRAYEAPRIENVLSPDDLEREMLYAGPGSVG